MEEKQNGQLNNDNNQSTTTSGQGANFSTQNTKGNVVGNDTAGIGSGAVVSLKGGQTQREIDEQRKIEELKSKAVKLERKLTPREKELERMHKEAVSINTDNFTNTYHVQNNNNETITTKPQGTFQKIKNTLVDNNIETELKNNEKIEEVLKNNKNEVFKNNQANISNKTPIINTKIKQENQALKIPEISWEEKKVDLKELSKEKRIDIQATPSMASVKFNMDDDLNKDMVKWFNKYNELPINIKLGLGSIEIREKIKEFAIKNNLMDENSLGEISRIIREVYIDLIKKDEIKKRLIEILNLPENTIDEALKYIGEIVAEVKLIGNKKAIEYFDQLPIKEALEKYKKLATQEVTKGQLIKKDNKFEQPTEVIEDKYIKPTIENWLDDYINNTGTTQHSNLERAKYLSDSKNTKWLDDDERNRVAKLIKSYDENTKLIIDKEEEKVMWQLHGDESNLGINSDKNKRVINKFKIEEAQNIDIDNNGNSSSQY